MNRIAGRVALVLSLIALISVLVGIVTYTEPPPTDEGVGAHVFQLSIALLALTMLVVLATADWSRPARSIRPLAIPAGVVILAFGALYYLEHVR